VKRLARMLRIPPSDILEWSTRKFWLNWAIMCAPEEVEDLDAE
jgi:hypothetical protein